MPPPDHRVHLRDGDREIEVSGNPAFVRQVLDDLPTLMARLRGEVPGRTTISMPAPPAVPAIDAPEPAAQLLSTQTPADLPAAGENEPPARNGNGTGVRRGARKRVDGAPSVEAQVFEVLRGSTRPLPIAAIRERMDADVSGQLVRRLLERASDRVTVSADRPATYSLR